jgi:DNA-directed RNA polymerase-3 subunit RPC5
MEEDCIIARLPIHFTNAFEPNIQMHQFPLLTRPLQVPPTAAAAGKRIQARYKSEVHKLEIHVPVDTRPEVWNVERGVALAQARVEDDREKNQELAKPKHREGEEPRLSEVRLQSERVGQTGVYMLGIVRGDRLNLHPISETYQFRPTLTYLDAVSKKNKRMGDDDSDSDDGPPLDPEEPAPVASPPKKEKKPAGEAKEVQVTARKVTDDKNAGSMQGGLSASRRDMLALIRAEEDDIWQNLEFCDGSTEEAGLALESVFSKSTEELECTSNIRTLLKSIPGL